MKRASASTRIATAIAAALAPVAANAQPDAEPAVDVLHAVVVTARVDSVSAFQLPASLNVVGLDDLARPGIRLTEALDGVPGVLARDRQNHAQDAQISIRGFGARTTFGVRGIRLYADGIPATMPDGQGQTAHFNLLDGDRVEILRGPFSALYGNSSGGVIQLWSAAPTADPELTAQVRIGNDAGRTFDSRLRGTAGPFGYTIAAQHFTTDGYRDHSAAERTSRNAKLDVGLGAAGTLGLVVNAFESEAQDPLGLSWAEVGADRRQATPQAGMFDTRKSVRQNQAGLLHSIPLDAHQVLRTRVYVGTRRVAQYQAIPVAAQSDPLHSGGVIDLDNDYGGADARWSWSGALGGRPLEVSVGTTFDRQRQHRRGFENFIGDTLGVRGRLRRDERDISAGFDQYGQAYWQFSRRGSLLMGLRRSEVKFTSRDHYIVGANPDDSGNRSYARTTPVVGVSFAPHEDFNAYLSSGRGFETPTFNEIGYRADGGAGLAFDLKPSLSRNLELGAKWRGRAGAHVEIALFRADTDDELAVARSVGGRSSYRNVGGATRRGAELALGLPLSPGWSLELAYTRLDARFRNAFPICTSAGCSDPTALVAAGTRIPGTARHQLHAALGWRRNDWHVRLEGAGIGDATVNDQGSTRAPGHVLLNAQAGRRWSFMRGVLEGFVRMDNVLDKETIGSVIVNEGNGRYFEPGPGRSLMIGARFNRDW
ncbi:MAG: TonB-dependent receptor [Xanthomonadales bacterium]|nr:TonB-dependent receptor [Xanthomonadales bacterium]